MTTNLPVHIIEAEPRVLDTDLAKALGAASVRFMRKNLVEANRAELETFGGLCATSTNSGPRGGRPGTAYYLNEEQALLVCMLSRTERAKQVRAEVIRVFVAFRRGEIGPKAEPELDLLPPPDFTADAFTKADARRLCQWFADRQKQQREEIRAMLAEHGNILAKENWYGVGHLKKHLLAPDMLARHGVQLLPAPTPETTFVTAYEVCREVLDDESMHRALTSIVATRLVDHGRRHHWPQGQTEKRTRADRPSTTFPRARTDEWLSAGGRAFIEAENRRLHARGGQQAALRLVPPQPGA